MTIKVILSEMLIIIELWPKTILFFHSDHKKGIFFPEMLIITRYSRTFHSYDKKGNFARNTVNLRVMARKPFFSLWSKINIILSEMLSFRVIPKKRFFIVITKKEMFFYPKFFFIYLLYCPKLVTRYAQKTIFSWWWQKR